MSSKDRKDNSTKNLSSEIHFVEDLKRQWMATVDALVDPLMIADKYYTILKANLAMARVSGRSVRAIIGMKCHEVIASRPTPCEGCKLKTTIKNQKAQEFELITERELDGVPRSFESSLRDRVYEVMSQPFAIGDGEPAVVHVYRDRTDARILRERLMQSEKLNSLGLLAGGVAHEINNPLGGILIFAGMLKKELPADSRFREDVDEILKAAERCKNIVADLLAFARSNTYRKTEVRESSSVEDVIQAALQLARLSYDSNKLKVKTDFQSGLTISVHKNKMIQILLNLIQNAVHAMKGMSKPQLSLRSQLTSEGAVQIVVEDNGVGIPPEIQAKVFDPFFTTKDVGEGTGLGLSISYGLAEELGAVLTFESKQGLGTIFKLTFAVV